MTEAHAIYRYRTNWRGKIILQIGELKPYNFDPQHDIKPGGYSRQWRDAKAEDVMSAFSFNDMNVDRLKP